jgi:hypothetical protein
MIYLVAHAPVSDRSPIGIEEVFDVESALTLACRWLSEGRANVAIGRATGQTVSGEELAACCRGEKMLTADLRVLDGGTARAVERR